MTAFTPASTEVLLEMLGRELMSDRLIVDPEVLQSLSHDEAEWATVGTAAIAVRASNEAEVRTAVRIAAELGAPVVPRGAGTGLSGGANAVDNCLILDLSKMDRDRRDRPGQPDLRGPAGGRQQRPEGHARRPRALVPAGPGQRALVDDRRQCRDQRRRAVLPEVRRHPRLRAGHAGRRRRRRRATEPPSGWVGGPPKALPDTTSPG